MDKRAGCLAGSCSHFDPAGNLPLDFAWAVRCVLRPLLLHASSQAVSLGHRRVLHFVYHSGEPMVEEWHRQV